MVTIKDLVKNYNFAEEIPDHVLNTELNSWLNENTVFDEHHTENINGNIIHVFTISADSDGTPGTIECILDLTPDAETWVEFWDVENERTAVKSTTIGENAIVSN